MIVSAPFVRPFYLFAKPVCASCNMSCEYCYYLQKEKLYEDSRFRVMSSDLLELFVKEYIQSQTTADVLFTWHGGEPLLRGLEFYKQVIILQNKYAGGRHIDNCIQTNGTLIDDEWAKFFADNHWLVGVSLDGPQYLHDKYRRMRGGEASFTRVMKGVEALNRHDAEWNAMAVVTRDTGNDPLSFYHFYKQIECYFIQFTPLVESQRLDISVTPDCWGDFLCTIFSEWVRFDVGKYFIQLFDATLANWCGETPGICSMSPYCGHAAAIEWNGDVYSCDHFVFPEYKLGNIRTHGIPSMIYSEKQQHFGKQKRERLPSQCHRCRWLFACWGECPKNRFAKTADGEYGLNYLCKGYCKFFSFVKPYMDYMRDEYLAGRAPANVMGWHPKS